MMEHLGAILAGIIWLPIIIMYACEAARLRLPPEG